MATVQWRRGKSKKVKLLTLQETLEAIQATVCEKSQKRLLQLTVQFSFWQTEYFENFENEYFLVYLLLAKNTSVTHWWHSFEPFRLFTANISNKWQTGTLLQTQRRLDEIFWTDRDLSEFSFTCQHGGSQLECLARRQTELLFLLCVLYWSTHYCPLMDWRVYQRKVWRCRHGRVSTLRLAVVFYISSWGFNRFPLLAP